MRNGILDANCSREMERQDDGFTRGYIECALWCEAEEIGDNSDVSDLAPEALARLQADATDFQVTNSKLLRRAALFRPMSHLGHDFWLTRNGHGAGFWDRGLGKLGDELTAMAEPYGTCSMYLGDDDRIYTCS